MEKCHSHSARGCGGRARERRRQMHSQFDYILLTCASDVVAVRAKKERKKNGSKSFERTFPPLCLCYLLLPPVAPQFSLLSPQSNRLSLSSFQQPCGPTTNKALPIATTFKIYILARTLTIYLHSHVIFSQKFFNSMFLVKKKILTLFQCPVILVFF